MTGANFHTTDDLIGDFVYPGSDSLAAKDQIVIPGESLAWSL